MLELKTEYLFDYCGRVRPFSEWLIVGDGGRGTRVIGPVVSETVEGTKVNGVIPDVGADWFAPRHDNAASRFVGWGYSGSLRRFNFGEYFTKLL
jgi:hypothetical protein